MHNFIGRYASRRLKNKILQTLVSINSDIHTLLDASCGDDDLVLRIADRNIATNIICNDISTRHLNFLARKNNSIIFTNHDLLDIPFKLTFDVVICKNTLHHLRSDFEITAVFKKFKKIGKTIMIMDIEDPLHSSWISWIWNKYYVYFLDDQGANFLTNDRLDTLLSSVFDRKEYTISKIRTIKGTYLFALISPSIHTPC